MVNGTGVNFNFTTSDPIQTNKDKWKPFVMNLRTKQIHVSQSCRKDYDGAKLMIL